MKTIEFENEMYELVGDSVVDNKNGKITLVLKKVNPFKDLSLDDLAYKLGCLDDELRYAREEAESYQSRVDEFRYCGYNEEDPDFHGMCLHQNSLDDEVNELEDEYSNVLEEIEKRLDNDSTEIACLLNEYDIAY